MKIEIDLNDLLENRLFPSDYILLKLLFEKNYSKIRDFNRMYYWTDSLVYLQTEGYIHVELVAPDKINFEGIVLRQKALDLFINSDIEGSWNHFKAMYPIKIGSRRLHDNQENCKAKFLKLAANPRVYKEIIKGFNNEVAARRAAALKREFFPDWKLMSVYLNQKHWLVYLNNIVEETVVKERVEGI